MRLTELKPCWTGYGDENTQIINGITFLCPHCGLVTGQRLGVLFTPPIDKDGWVKRGVTIFHGAVEWTRGEGDTFETLTLSPSIYTEHGTMDFACHWHGFITNGEVIN